MTSSSARMPGRERAMRRETVPLTTAMPCLQPCMAAKRFSKFGDLPAIQSSHFRCAAFAVGVSLRLAKMGQGVISRVRTGLPPRERVL